MLVLDELERCLYRFGAEIPGVPAGEGEADCALRLMVDVIARGHEVSIFGAIIRDVYAMSIELPRSGIRLAWPELTFTDRLESDSRSSSERS